MIKEKFIAYFTKYLILTTVIMTLGLIHSDGYFRGIPFGWLWAYGGGHIMTSHFIMSLVLTLAGVIIADLIAKAVMRAKEPTLKTLTATAKTAPEVAFDMDEEWDERFEPGAAIKGLKKINIPGKIKNDRSGKSDDKTKWSGVLGTVATIVVIVATLFSCVDDITNDDYDSDDYSFYNSLEEGDVILGDEEDDEYIDPMQQEFSDLMWNLCDEQNPIGEFADEEGSERVLDLCDWNGVEMENYYTYVFGADGFAVTKFRALNPEGSDYYVAIIYELGTETESYGDSDDDEYIYYSADIRGMAVCPADDAPDVIGSYAYDAKERAEVAEYLKKYEITVGTADIKGISILQWTDDFEDLHLGADGADA